MSDIERMLVEIARQLLQRPPACRGPYVITDRELHRAVGQRGIAMTVTRYIYSSSTRLVTRNGAYNTA